jgi:hypothetical protein
VVDSENPLGSPESAQIDQRLLGYWIAKNGDIIYFSAKDAHWMLAVTTPKASESPDPSTAKNNNPESDLFFVTTIGDETYLSMRSASGDSKIKYSFYRYTITPEQTLQMWGMSQDEMAAAVRAGKLKGTVQDNGTTGKPPRTDLDVHLTDSSEHLVKFISRHDPTEIFNEEMDPLTKVATKGD